MSIDSQGVAPTTAHTRHPFDPITPHEIRLVARILEAAFPGVALRYNRIDLHEPIKNDVVPYIEAERLRKPLPPRPARLLYSYFHRQDNGACYKSLVNADSKTVVSTKAIPEGVQVGIPDLPPATKFRITDISSSLGSGGYRRTHRHREPLHGTPRGQG